MRDLILQMSEAWARHKGREARVDSAHLEAQAKVAEGIFSSLASASSGRLVVLMGPTGSGKTEVFSAVYIAQWVRGEWFAGRLFVVEPVHALLRQMRDRLSLYGRLFGVAVGEDHGEAASPRFLYSAPVTLTTVDSYAYGYLAKRVDKWPSGGSVTGRFTMPVGVMAHAVSVFDEAHLVQDEVFLGPRALARIVCSLVKAGAHVILSTATLPPAVLREFEARCGEPEVYKLPGRPRNLSISRMGKPLEAGDVECDGATLVIVNTVAKARRVYKELSQRCNAHIIHSLMRRGEREGALVEVVNAIKGKENVVLVGTQAVEVGIDLSFNRLYTELSPLDSLIQRIGRVGREGERAEVVVYAAERPEPYVKEVVDATEQVLSSSDVAEALNDVDKTAGLLGEVYNDGVVKKLAERGEALLADFVDYLERLHLFATPPERDVQIRPSIYVDIYLAEEGELGKVESGEVGLREEWRLRLSIPLTKRWERLTPLLQLAKERGCKCGSVSRGRAVLKEECNELWGEGVVIVCRDLSGIYDGAGLVVENLTAREEGGEVKKKGRRRGKR